MRSLLLLLFLAQAACSTLPPIKDSAALSKEYSIENVHGEVVHLFEVDLNHSMVKPIKAHNLALTQLAKEHDAIAAINAGFFGSDGTPAGLLIVDKTILGYQEKPRAALGWKSNNSDVLLDRVLFTRTNPQFFSLTGRTTHQQWQQMDFVLGGTPLLVFEHKAITDFGPEKVREAFITLKHARTAVCVKDQSHWALLVVEGSSSLQLFGDRRGFTIPELAQYMQKQLSCRYAINLDGGGSSALVVNGTLVNNTTYSERPVSDALGVFERATSQPHE